MVAATIVMSIMWNYQFERYVHDKLQGAADVVADRVEQYYPAYGFGYGTIVQLYMPDRRSEVGLQLLDAKSNIVWDEASMRRHWEDTLRQNTGAAAPSLTKPTIVLQPTGQVVTSPIVVDGVRVGTVRVWAQGAQDLLTPTDLQFRKGSLMALALAAIVAVIFAILSGALYSTRLVKPIDCITRTAQALQGGDSSARTGLQADDEIGFLGKTFDEMADSIEADRELERRLTADVAHELRTPLQAIQATVEAMQDGVLPADEERFGIVRDETRRLARLADGILELTRLERGSSPFDMQRLEVAGPVRSAIDSLEALIETCELTLTSDIAEGLYVLGDRDRLQQAVGNLLSNAARYTPAHGSVQLAVRQDGGCALIEVTDTGIGIAEKDLGQVFARFWRADGARTTATGGLGIGLAVTREIVERHHGSIEAAGRPDGTSGAVFRIRLPLA
jgi:two-component system, OmpR family, sensor histidine kinase BaeS